MICFIIILVVLFYIINYRNIEKFSTIGGGILTSDAQDTIGLINQQQMAQPCKVRMDNGQDFEFKVTTKQLPWNAVTDQPNTCAIDASSYEINNLPTNCSKLNPVLYDGGTTTSVVDSVYWNDLQDNPKCEIKFKGTPSANNMDNYLHKQPSYIEEAKCQTAFKEVKDITIDNQKLNSDISDSSARIATQQEQIKQKTAQLYALNSSIQGLEQDRRDLQNQLSTVQNNLANAQNQLADAKEQYRLLDIQKSNMISGYEHQLIVDKQTMIQMQIDQANALVAQHNADLNSRAAMINSKNQELQGKQANANVLANDIKNLTANLNSNLTINNNLQLTLADKQKQLVTGQTKTLRVFYANTTMSADWNNDVVRKIQNYLSANFPSNTLSIKVDVNGSSLSTLSKANYDVLMISTDSGAPDWSRYIQSFVDSGGGLIVTTFANASEHIPNLDYTRCSPIQNGDVGQGLGGNMSLNSASIVSHPITNGLTSFNSGSSGYGGNPIKLNSGATKLASYTSGNSLIAVQTFGSARTVNLNFYPVSKDGRGDMWSGDGGLMMARSILWIMYLI
jgi:hypothetical protein